MAVPSAQVRSLWFPQPPALTMASRPRLRAVPLAALLLSERRHEDRNGDTDGESHSTRCFMEGPERAFGGGNECVAHKGRRMLGECSPGCLRETTQASHTLDGLLSSRSLVYTRVRSTANPCLLPLSASHLRVFCSGHFKRRVAGHGSHHVSRCLSVPDPLSL